MLDLAPDRRTAAMKAIWHGKVIAEISVFEVDGYRYLRDAVRMELLQITPKTGKRPEVPPWASSSTT